MKRKGKNMNINITEPELLSAYIDGQLTKEELKRVNHVLASSFEARQEFEKILQYDPARYPSHPYYCVSALITFSRISFRSINPFVFRKILVCKNAPNICDPAIVKISIGALPITMSYP